MDKDVIVKNVGKKGKGLFALRDFKIGEMILHNDTSKLKKYSLKEIFENPKLNKNGEHCDYVGRGKYVIDFSQVSYMNHSCDPNAYVEFKVLGKTKVIAIKPIKKGEEITVDYSLGAVDQIIDKYPKKYIHYWKMKCYCSSKNCRKIIHGDFFKLPRKIQKEKLQYLPTFIKTKYRDWIKLIIVPRRKSNTTITHAQILVFGDSIALGMWDVEGGWVQRLRWFLDKRTLSDPNFYCVVYNLGISGDTAEGLLERFEFETKKRLSEEEEVIFIFAIGINDSEFVHDKKGRRYTNDQFRKNIKKLICLARKFSSTIIFIGLTPVDELKVDPIPWAHNYSYRNKHVREFNDIVKSVCKENEIYFVGLFETWIKTDYKKLLEDGGHPNSKGHEKIFRTVKSFLFQSNIISGLKASRSRSRNT